MKLSNNATFRVLHVDDDVAFLEISKEILQAENDFEVDHALSVDEAFEKLALGQYDVVVSDYEMPRKDGLQFLAQLREQNSQMPFILLTGKGREEVAIKALNLGANYYLNKHGSPETIYGELAHAIVNSARSARVENALRESEAKYRELINGMNDTVWVIDFEGNFIDVNDTSLRVLGYSRDELLSLGIRGIDKHLSREKVQELLNRLPAVGTQVFETEHTTKAGQTIPVEISSSLVTYQGKQAILSIARNITKRKETEAKLCESLEREKFLADFVRNSSVAIAVGYPDGRLGMCNNAFQNLVGYSEEELKSIKWSTVLTPPEWLEGEMKKLEELCRTKISVQYEKEYIRKDGLRVPIELVVHPFFDDCGNVSHYYAFIRDITERKKAEEALGQSEELSKAIIVNAPIGIAVTAPNFRILTANEAFCRITGYSEAELKKLTFEDFTHPDDVKRSISNMAKLKSGSIPFFSLERRHIKKDGAVRDGRVIVSTVRDKEGKTTCYIAELEDITERKKAEESLRRSEEKFRLFFENEPVYSYMVSPSGELIDINQYALESFGYTKEEIVGKPVLNLYAPSSRENAKALFTKFLETGKISNEELSVITKSGEERTVLLSVNAFYDEKGKLLHSISVQKDITERKKIEETLRIVNSRYELAQRAAKAGVWEWNVKTGEVVWTEKMFELFGLDPKKATSSFPTWIGVMHPEDQKRAKLMMDEALKSRSFVDLVFRIVKPDGEIRWINARGHGEYDDLGNMLSMNGICIDITEHKKTEEKLRKLNRALRTISKSNQALIRATDVTALAQEVCKIIVKDCGYELAWVGSAEHDTDKTVRPIAYEGFDKEYIDALRITWKDEARGRGPTGTAIRTGKPYICRTLLTDPNFEPWCEQAAKRGYASSIALPLMSESNVVGALNIYSKELDPFAEEEVTLLTELASDLGYGFNMLKMRTDKEHTEAMLRARENTIALIYSTVSEVLFSLAVEPNNRFRFISVNQSFLDATGLQESQVVGKSVEEVIPEPSLTMVLEKYKQAIREKKTVSWEEITVYPAGKKYGEVTVAPLFDSDGRCTNLIGNVHDISERKQAEEALITAKNEWEQTFHAMPDLIAIIDDQYRIVRANRAMAQKFGLPPEQCIGLTCYKYVHGTDAPPEFCPHVQTMKDGQEHVSEMNLPKLGGYFIIRTNPLKDENGRLIGAVHVARDITERKKVEQILKDNEQRHRYLFENSSDGMMLTKPDGSILVANPAACRMLGMTEEEIIKAGRGGIVVKDEKLAVALKERELTGKVRAELTFKRKDGTTFVGETSSVRFTDSEGTTKTSLIIRDISERKRVEETQQITLAKLKDLNEKLNVVGSLTRHDVSNKLGVVSSNVFLLKKKLGDNPEAILHLDRIDSAIDAAARLFEFSRLYEKIGSEKLHKVNVDEYFTSAASLFAELGGIKVDSECRGLTVTADSLLRQLFYNLIDNTLKHGEKATQIKLHCQKGQNEVKLIYEDNGVGIPDVDKPKLFTEGFTTGKGSGLGLRLVKKMLEVYGWSITEQGNEGMGAKFVISIPERSLQ